jgi:hypothetical protein
MRPLVDPNFSTTKAQDFITISLISILALDPAFITAQHLTFANFLILPEFALTGCAFDGQHN